MPENPTPAANTEANSEPAEFNFDKTASDSPRIKRRSLKTKALSLQTATQAPALGTEPAAKPSQPAPVGVQNPVKAIPVAPPKSIPTTSSSTVAPAAEPKAAVVADTKSATPSSNGVTPSASGQKVNIALTSSQKTTAAVLAASEAKGPHGTRPATLYYTSQPKKEATSSMKPTTTATSASSATRPATAATSTTTSAARPASAASAPSSAARPAAAASASASRPVTASVAPASAARPAGGGFDYRANVERQSREQKSVGSILSYFVYGLIAVFVIGASLATYGTVIIFDRLHDHATSISSLDDKYAQKDAELTKAIVTMQDSLSQSNATIAQQRDLLNKQEEEINQLHAAINSANSATADAIHAEARARANEAAALKARLRDLENRTSQNGTMSIRP